MKLTLSQFDFTEWMQQNPNNPFSYEALELLWDYLENYEDNTGEEIEFDPVGFRCEFCESSFNEIISENNLNAQGLDEEADKKLAFEFLNKNTTVLGITEHGTVVYQNF
jgi:hypothetical protein